MNNLIKWQSEEKGRQFILRANTSCYETRYKLIMWVQKDGQPREGFPGEGYGLTVEDAFEMAHSNLINQKSMNRESNQQWYFPIGVEFWVRHIVTGGDAEFDALEKFREGVELIK